jgi:alkaline phosphatase
MQVNRNHIIFLLLLFVFAIGCGKSDNDPEKPPQHEEPARKNLILLIGDGMGLSHITAASVANRQPLHMERCRYIGINKVYASDKLVPSSASAITAMASGVKTNYEHIGVDVAGQTVQNIAQIAAAAGYATGIVTTSFIADATPAGFFAHNPDRYDREGIAMDLLQSQLQVVIGGGRDHYNKRSDELNLLDSLIVRGFLIYDDLAAAMSVNKGRLAVFTDEFRPPKISEGRDDMLTDATKLALKLLQNNEKGFFLMVEGAQIDLAGHANDNNWMIDEMLDFDKAVGVALDFAEKDGNTLVIVASDHETGGYAVTGGDELSGEAYGEFVTTFHTADMVPLFAHGTGAAAFAGIYKNTGIFYRMMDFFGLKTD